MPSDGPARLRNVDGSALEILAELRNDNGSVGDHLTRR